MILGTDTDEERDAWNDLLASPDAAAAWREAVERRARIDAFARMIANHSWLADASLQPHGATHFARSWGQGEASEATPR